MITINKGYITEQITKDEFIRRFPDVHKALNTPPDYIAEGKRLQAVRMKYRKTLREVAERLGMTVSELNNIEQGRKSATSRIVDAYGMLGLKERK